MKVLNIDKHGATHGATTLRNKVNSRFSEYRFLSDIEEVKKFVSNVPYEYIFVGDIDDFSWVNDIEFRHETTIIYYGKKENIREFIINAFIVDEFSLESIIRDEGLCQI